MLSLLMFIAPVAGQLAGTKVERPPVVDVAHCTASGGCVLERTNATLDANWRWIHGVHCYGEQCWSSGNCYTGGSWDSSKCPDPKSCAETCALEAVTAQEYRNTYGVSEVQGGVELKFKSGNNIGSRLYLTEAGGEKYKLFRLKNREFTFDVDVSTLACGINGAVYFSEMDVDGGKGGTNKAGAKYGTGYCDAQCPHDVKFINGEANLEEWNSTTHFGKYGVCCAEMDIWEANRAAEALTTHPCNITGPKVCNGLDCGGKPDEYQYRYQGVCDKDGCDLNPYRDGEKKFFGSGPEFTVDSSRPFSIVTQWLTNDGTDTGDLSEIRRMYVQDGQVIANSRTSILPGKDSEHVSITDEYCDAQKAAFGDPNEHKAKGGLKAMGEALDRGVVLVLSIWDDSLSHMLWLDSSSGDPEVPGNARGPCSTASGAPNEVRAKYANAYVRYTNIMYGEINSTYTNPMPTAAPTTPSPPAPPSPPNPSPVPSPSPSPSPAPSPRPPPAPVPSPVSGSCCWGPSCASPYSCSSDGDWCSLSSDHCEGNCGGKWCGSSALLGTARRVRPHTHLRGEESEAGAMMQTFASGAPDAEGSPMLLGKSEEL